MDDPRVFPAQLLGKIDRRVTGTSARNQDAKTIIEVLFASEAIMVDHRQ
jgi:hypothetical protein